MKKRSFGVDNWRSCVAAGLVLLFAGVAGAQAASPLASGDLVFVKVHRHPDLSTTTQIDDSGHVTLPYVGRVDVSGLSESEASARLASALTAILKSPRVSVSRSASGLGSMDFGERSVSMETRVVSLDNSDAESIFEALAGSSSPGGAISFDQDTNSIIITDEPAALQSIISAIDELDQMRSQLMQVHIETKIAEVETNAIKETGIRWFAQGDRLGGGYTPNGRQDARVNSLRGTSDPLFQERLDSTTGQNNSGGGANRRFIDEANFDRRLQIPVQVSAPGQLFLGYLNSGIDLGAMLDALVADNKAELLATPYIRTVNHKAATIRMTEEFPYNEVSTAGLSAVASVRFLDIGIILQVTPHVRRDPDGVGYVQLELEPEVSTATGVANGVPVRSVRSSSSVANVRSNQTLVIGGIVQSDARDVVQKVPGVGNIPLVGNLFKHKERSQTARELMIFVTPTIHEQPEGATWSRTLDMESAASAEDLLLTLEARAERKD